MSMAIIDTRLKIRYEQAHTAAFLWRTSGLCTRLAASGELAMRRARGVKLSQFAAVIGLQPFFRSPRLVWLAEMLLLQRLLHRGERFQALARDSDSVLPPREKEKRRAMRYVTLFIGIALSVSNAAISAQLTNTSNHLTTFTVETISMQQDENPFQYCRRVGTDDQPGDVPAVLTSAFMRVFGVRMTPAEIQRNSSYRCYRGKVMGCMIGANLNCGKADTRKTSHGGDEWCRSHPDDTMIPMAATGHATIYVWRCSGDRAVPTKVISKVDREGFELLNWKPLN